MRRITIVNETCIPTDRLRAIVRFAAPSGKWRARIRFAHGRHPHGRAGTYKCVVWVPQHYRYPVKFREGGGYLGTVCYSQEECLVDLTAHELRHCQRRQVKVRTLRRYGGRRNGHAATEGDCDMYAVQVLRAWRRHGRPAPNQRLVIPPSPARLNSGAPCAPVAPPAPTPEETKAMQRAAKAAKLVAAQKRWRTKAKRAATALRKIERQLKRLDRLARAA